MAKHAFVGYVIALFVFPTLAQDPMALSTSKDKESYAVGVDLARNLRRRGVSLETEALLRGMRDEFSSSKLLLTEDDLRETLNALQAEERRKMILARRGPTVVADENAHNGAVFLAQNRTNPGVVCLPSGLQYKILKAGNGRKPTATDTVECQFRGSLISGQQFAGSEPGQPATFKMVEVIPGWKEALQLMPVGSKWQLFIPPQLAFGDPGVGRSRLGAKIGPNTTLVYEVELLAIK
jgi:UDP-GlcNAc:undecaprenyl-phosphate/decaprenyl-phosphate GlcNAc-1-phosphate transferase